MTMWFKRVEKSRRWAAGGLVHVAMLGPLAFVLAGCLKYGSGPFGPGGITVLAGGIAPACGAGQSTLESPVWWLHMWFMAGKW